MMLNKKRKQNYKKGNIYSYKYNREVYILNYRSIDDSWYFGPLRASFNEHHASSDFEKTLELGDSNHTLNCFELESEFVNWVKKVIEF